MLGNSTCSMFGRGVGHFFPFIYTLLAGKFNMFGRGVGHFFPFIYTLLAGKFNMFGRGVGHFFPFIYTLLAGKFNMFGRPLPNAFFLGPSPGLMPWRRAFLVILTGSTPPGGTSSAMRFLDYREGEREGEREGAVLNNGVNSHIYKYMCTTSMWIYMYTLHQCWGKERGS